MEITLERAGLDQAERIWKMQIEAFADLLKKYQDYDTNPGAEKIDKVRGRLMQENTSFYVIKADGDDAGAIRIATAPDGEKRISPIFVLEKYRNMGVAQSAIRQVEEIHGADNWTLDTILEEKGNCHLYEKMGYISTGKTMRVNDKLTLILYHK